VSAFFLAKKLIFLCFAIDIFIKYETILGVFGKMTLFKDKGLCSISSSEQTVFFDLVLSESYGTSAELGELTVEQGYSVVDNIFINPYEGSFKAVLTAASYRNTRLTGIKEVANNLQNIFDSGELVTLDLYFKTYDNIVLSSISFNVGDGEKIEVDISFKEIKSITFDSLDISANFNGTSLTSARATSSRVDAGRR